MPAIFANGTNDSNDNSRATPIPGSDVSDTSPPERSIQGGTAEAGEGFTGHPVIAESVSTARKLAPVMARMVFRPVAKRGYDVSEVPEVLSVAGVQASLLADNADAMQAAESACCVLHSAQFFGVKWLP